MIVISYVNNINNLIKKIGFLLKSRSMNCNSCLVNRSFFALMQL